MTISDPARCEYGFEGRKTYEDLLRQREALRAERERLEHPWKSRLLDFLRRLFRKRS
jgi:hypothetical protein